MEIWKDGGFGILFSKNLVWDPLPLSRWRWSVAHGRLNWLHAHFSATLQQLVWVCPAFSGLSGTCQCTGSQPPRPLGLWVRLTGNRLGSSLRQLPAASYSTVYKMQLGKYLFRIKKKNKQHKFLYIGLFSSVTFILLSHYSQLLQCALFPMHSTIFCHLLYLGVCCLSLPLS